MSNSKLFWTIRDGWTMSLRSFKHIVRNPESLFLSMGLPVILMLLFVYVFGGAINIGTEYVNYVVPGVIIICFGFSSSITSVSVTQDMVGGLFERFRSMPLQPSSLLTGHVIGSIARNAISGVLVLIVALLIGFESNASFFDWLGVIGVLSLFTLAISWLSVVIGLIAKTVETASSFTFIFMFLPYASSAFVPTETMPSWLHTFAENQPLTPLIERVRGLLIGSPLDNNLALTMLWFGGFLLLSIIYAIFLFNRRKSK